MSTYTESELREIIEKHGMWLRGEKGGERADLTGADLSRSNLSRSNLSHANLMEANLSRSNLTWSNLTGSNLTWSNLTGSNLSRSDLMEANLSGADLMGTDLSHANLMEANLSRSNLTWSNLTKANLSWANLSWANLSWANLTKANLRGANLSWANLSGAEGISPERTTPLLILQEQVGKIRAYKLVNADYKSPIQNSGKLTYKVGDVLEEPKANTNPLEQCAEGINLCTLDWCLRSWQEGYHIMVCEFTAKDIAVIPTATDGKFRVKRCRVVGEYDPTPIFEREGE